MIKDPRFDPKLLNSKKDERKEDKITSKEIANSSILSNHIATGSITPEKISSDWPAFYAYSSGANKTTVAGQILVFDGGVRYNVGNHYNSTTYRFTVPFNGLYYFWLGYFNNATTGPDRMYLAINGSSNTHPYFLAPSNVVGSAHMGGYALFLNTGDIIDIRAQYGGGIYYGGHTAWGGYLIR